MLQHNLKNHLVPVIVSWQVKLIMFNVVKSFFIYMKFSRMVHRKANRDFVRSEGVTTTAA